MTLPKDRSFAISGLQNRLAAFYKTECTYGIVHRYLHKSLLWQPSGDEVTRINHPEADVVPSWSWMAYQGGIRYGTSSLHGLNWDHIQLTTTDELRSDGKKQYILEAPLGRIRQSCHIEDNVGMNSKVLDIEHHLVGWIRYDCEKEDVIERLGCIAAAQYKHPSHGWATSESANAWKNYAGVQWPEELVSGDFHYVLLVKRIAPEEEGKYVEEVYRRIGVGVVQSGQLSFEPRLMVKVV
jgi:hypothetical protein